MKDKYKGYIIGRGSPGYYVCKDEKNYDIDGETIEQYLHKDFTFHRYCGAENFYDTPEIAKEAIDTLEYKMNKHIFITEGEFSS